MKDKTVCRALFVFAFTLICLAYSAHGMPANDDFTDADVIVGSSASIVASNTAATAESGEPDHAANTAAASVWWSWTAPASGSASMDTDGSSFDTVLGVYTGATVSALTEIDSNDDGSNPPQSSVDIVAVAGVTYFIAVDGVFRGDWRYRA